MLCGMLLTVTFLSIVDVCRLDVLLVPKVRP